MLGDQIYEFSLSKVSLQIRGFSEKLQSRSVNAIKYYSS